MSARRFVLLLAALAAAVALALPAVAGAHGEPEITVKPASVKTGEKITVLGEGFEAGSQVVLTLKTAAGSMEFATVTADAEGNIRLEQPVPSDLTAGGVQVEAASGETRAVARFTLQGAAGAEGGTVATQLALTGEQQEDGHILLTATLTDGEGMPVSDAPVEFLLNTTLLGVAGQVNVGEAKTDAGGRASLEWKPTFKGSMEGVARFDGVGFYSPSDATSSFEVTQAEPAYVHEKPALGAVRDWAPVGLVLVVLGVWSVFAFVGYQILRIGRAGGEA